MSLAGPFQLATVFDSVSQRKAPEPHGKCRGGEDVHEVGGLTPHSHQPHCGRKERLLDHSGRGCVAMRQQDEATMWALQGIRRKTC